MLATWMGLDSLPRKREARIRFLEEYLRENPTKLDSLVAQALKGHVEEEGLKRTAPWLAGFVVRALISSPSGETRTQLDQLLEQGAYAVTAYEEEGAKRGIALLASAMGSGWEYQGFRRGVLRDNRLDSLKVWTVRLSKGPSQRMVAVTSAKLEELDDKLIERIFGTVKRLSSSALLWLDVESSRLTGLAEAAGLFCYTGEDHETILTELENLPEPAPQERREAKRSELGDLLRGEKVPEVEALVPLVKGYRRTFQCFEASRGLTDESLPAIGERFAALLKAAHEVAPETARLNEGQTIVVSQLAQEPEGPIKTMLESEALLTRYGGPSLYTLGALSQILLEKGWLLQRAVVGTTRREREEHAELGDLAAGLWRLLVSQEGREGEVWYLSTCQADTVSSLGALLQDKRPTIVVYPSDSPAADWTAGLDLGCAEWGDSGALSAALDRLQSSSS
jgi:hypothetical protein